LVCEQHLNTKQEGLVLYEHLVKPTTKEVNGNSLPRMVFTGFL